MDGYASLEGTLQLLEERAAFPVNKVKIKCVQHEGTSTLDEIDVVFPKEMDWVLNFTIYWNDPLEYKIKWTDDVRGFAWQSLGCQKEWRPPRTRKSAAISEGRPRLFQPRGRLRAVIESDNL